MLVIFIAMAILTKFLGYAGIKGLNLKNWELHVSKYLRS